MCKKLTIHIPTRANFKVTKNYQTIVGFTDGSKDGFTGYGLHIMDMAAKYGYSEHGQLNSDNSVYQAETFAIYGATLKLLELNTRNRNIIIYSNCQAALKSMEITALKTTSTINCYKNLIKLADQNNKTGQLHFHSVVHGGNETSYVILGIFSSSSATLTLLLKLFVIL